MSNSLQDRAWEATLEIERECYRLLREGVEPGVVRRHMTQQIVFNRGYEVLAPFQEGQPRKIIDEAMNGAARRLMWERGV